MSALTIKFQMFLILLNVEVLFLNPTVLFVFYHVCNMMLPNTHAYQYELFVDELELIEELKVYSVYNEIHVELLEL